MCVCLCVSLCVSLFSSTLTHPSLLRIKYSNTCIHKYNLKSTYIYYRYCRFLQDESPLDLTKCVCVDLMSHGGEVALYGSAFDFQRIIDVNLTEAMRAYIYCICIYVSTPLFAFAYSIPRTNPTSPHT